MAGFVGAIVQVTLLQPPNAIVQGRVQEVVPGQALHLQDVYFPQNGTRWPTWTVQNSMIADLNVIQTSQAPPSQPATHLPIRTAPSNPTSHVQSAISSPAPAPQSSQPVDPAILSYARTPQRPTPHVDSSTTPSKLLPQTRTKQTPTQTAHIAPPPQSIDLSQAIAPNQGSEKVPRKQRQKKTRDVKTEAASVEPPPVINTDVSRNGNDMNGATKRGKGWRQTPLLHPTQAEAGQTKKRRRQRQVDGEAQNGWATEDATDIQDLGEFDFEANHKLFDKQQVFEQLRQDDTTADEDRLVSHNKLPPRKNLLPTEMVLSPKLAADGSEADTEVDFLTGRSSSRHSTSKRLASRANSGYLESRPHPLSASVSSDRAVSLSATSRSRTKPLPIGTGGSYRNDDRSPRSAIARKGRSIERPHMDPCFIMSKTNKVCPVLLPSALVRLESEALEYGVSAQAIVELAARCIADETIKLLENPAEFRRPSRTNTARGGLKASTTLDGGQPVIVLLVGNTSTGCEALAAVRHLITRKYHVIIAEELSNDGPGQAFQEQHQTLKKCIRAGAHIKRGSWRKASNYIKNLPGPPVAIIDALFEGYTYDYLIDNQDQFAATACEESRQMIDWANRSRAPVISITCPSGVDSSDGSAAIVDGEPLAVRPDKILAMGAPVTGVLEAMKAGEHWNVSVADIGINIALKPEDAVDFGADWVVPITLSSA